MSSGATVAEFVECVSARMAAGDHAGLVRACDAWSEGQLIGLLESSSPFVVRAAIIALGVKGTMRQSRRLAQMLHFADPSVVDLVEHALWSIWFRAGRPRSNAELARAIASIRAEDYAAADRILRQITENEPTFAEPHHQLGIVLSLTESLDDAAQEYREALRLNPVHFAAAAGLGHVYLEADALGPALDAYRRALEIHPRMSDVQELVASLEVAVQRGRGADEEPKRY